MGWGAGVRSLQVRNRGSSLAFGIPVQRPSGRLYSFLAAIGAATMRHPANSEQMGHPD